MLADVQMILHSPDFSAKRSASRDRYYTLDEGEYGERCIVIWLEKRTREQNWFRPQFCIAVEVELNSSFGHVLHTFQVCLRSF